jgi:HNH endonuclease
MPLSLEARRIGGAIRAAQQRDAAVASYSANPNHCLQCGTPIAVVGRVADARIKKFCDHRCAAINRNGRAVRHGLSLTASCAYCERSFRRKRLRVAKFCSRACINKARCRISLNSTKAEIFALRRGYQSARSSIQRHARETFKASGNPMACAVCRYEKHAEVAHRKSVADFPGEAKLSEINALANLVALCPNHHWEFDHGQLSLPFQAPSLHGACRAAVDAYPDTPRF